MSLNYHKAKPTTLGDAGLDERWLQERILEDPTLLGLGDVSVVQRERKQSPGGRIDFLMSDPETNTMYEVEVMLGRVDETRIIRSIEYWDIERRRWPTREHRAVIVAEEITTRFFNVIALFNRAIPMIAIKLGAVQVDDKIVLTFTTVLDIYEEPEEEGEGEADRDYWEKRSNPESLRIVDQCVQLLSTDGHRPRLTYHRGHITMGGNRQHFAWFHPRRVQKHCHFHVKVGEANLQDATAKLEAAGISVEPHRKNGLRVIVTPAEMKQHESVIREVLGNASVTVGGGLS